MKYQHQHNIGFTMRIKNWYHRHFTYQEPIVYTKLDDIESLCSEVDEKEIDDCQGKSTTRVEKTSDLLYMPMAKRKEE